MSEEIEHPTHEEIEERRFIASVKRNREALEWSQGKLAREMSALGWESFHQTTIRRIEDGERPVRLGEARALAKIFNTTVSQMMAPTEIELLMTSLANDLRELNSAETLIRDGIWVMDSKRQSLQYSFNEAEQNIDPEVWRDAGLSDQYRQIINKARGRVNMSTPEFVNEVLKNRYDTIERQSIANNEGLDAAGLQPDDSGE